jgi:hypothetical protein
MIRDNQIYMISLNCTRVKTSEAFREVPHAEDKVPHAENKVPHAEDTRGGLRTCLSLKLVSYDVVFN